MRSVWLAVAVVLAAGGAARAADGEPVLERCLVSLIDEAKVPAREAGVLVELPVREGDVVAKGDVIAKIDDNQPQMEKRKAQAEHDQAVAKAESDVDVRYSQKAKEVAFKAWEKAENAHKQSPGSVTEVERDRPVTVEVVLAGDRRETFAGRMVFVSPLDESGGDYRVVAEVENRRAAPSKQWLLRPGKTARMTVHAGQPPLPPVRRERPGS